MKSKSKRRRRVVRADDAAPSQPRPDIGPCFLCAKLFRETPATNIMMYDEAAGRFVDGKEPKMCDAHKETLREWSREKRREAYKGFEIAPPVRQEQPQDASQG